jgi:hypothetical protein
VQPREQYHAYRQNTDWNPELYVRQNSFQHLHKPNGSVPKLSKLPNFP